MLDRRVALRLEAIRRLMRKGAVANLRRIVEKTHPADLAAIFGELNDLEQGRLFQILSSCGLAGEVMSHLEANTLQQLMASLSDDEMAGILSAMESDDAADLLSLLPEERQGGVLAAMTHEDSQDIGSLLRYPEDSAGGIMTPSFFALGQAVSVHDAIDAIQGAEAAETVFYVYVVDDEERLVGVVSLRQLITSAPSTSLRQVMNSDVISVAAAEDQEQVARLVAKYDLLAIPVVETEGRLVGIITVDDVIDVLREEATEDVYKMVGTSQEELLYGNQVLPIARLRLPWLVVNLFGGVLTGTILWYFRATVEEIIALLSFLPVITGMGGNVGTQSSSILVRAFATGRVEFADLPSHLWKEMRVGLLLGVVCGVLVGAAAFVWHRNPALGVVVGVSMTAAMTVAATMGTLAPAFFRRLDIDPAVASGPFVSTANDITGILIYLGTASMLLRFLPHVQ
ncbi:MAG: magnesium transporter [Deferrisomatales bacterium]|nr:magnesium transporter [Deferrisomatales bacterium]